MTAAEPLANLRVYDYRESSKVGPKGVSGQGKSVVHGAGFICTWIVLGHVLGLNPVHPGTKGEYGGGLMTCGVLSQSRL